MKSSGRLVLIVINNCDLVVSYFRRWLVRDWNTCRGENKAVSEIVCVFGTAPKVPQIRYKICVKFAQFYTWIQVKLTFRKTENLFQIIYFNLAFGNCY